jgi:uncharacterized protein
MSVTVVGRAGVSLTPDVALVELACEGVADDPAGALGAASAGLEQVRRVLLAAGVAEVDLRSTDFSLWAETDPQGQPRGYRAARGLTATVRDLGRVGDVVSSAIEAGGQTSRVRGLTLQASGAEAARAQARDLAWTDAVSSATQLADLAGQQLGRALEIVDGEPSGGGPVPIGRAFAMAKDGGAGVDAGQLEITAAVTVTWELG